MFPETSFHEFGKHLMFVIVDNRIHHTKNLGFPLENYLYLCGLSFPLKKSETLKNMEKRYRKKNAEYLREFQDTYAKDIITDKSLLKNLEKGLNENKNLHFFLSEVVPAYIGKEIQSKEIITIKKEDSIFEKILEGNVAVINKRIYPLHEINVPSMVKVDDKNYFFKTSKKTIDKVEQEFKYNLEEKLKKEVLEKIEESNEIKEKLLKLNNKIRDLTVKKHISLVGNCFEYGDIGYDPRLQKVYCFLRPHLNKKTYKNYKSRLGAIAVGINPPGLETNFAVISRKNENSNFNIDSSSLCLGASPKGYTTKQIVGYLLKESENIRWNKAYHE